MMWWCTILLLLMFPLEVSSDGECPQQYTLTIPQAAVPKHTNKDKLIIAHRGASFHFPEHSLAAYRLALEMGADFVEPDLVATLDGHLIAMHTADLNVTTDVYEKFGSIREPWFSPYANRSGYWSFNFSLADIKTLRVRQRLPRARTTVYDGMFEVPTLTEIQQLVNTWNQEIIPQILLHVNQDSDDVNASSSPTDIKHLHYQQSAGIYAELKASPWFQNDANVNLVDLLLQTLFSNDSVFYPILTCPPSFKFDEYKVPPLVIQAFQGEVLRELTEKWKVETPIQDAPLPPMILLVDSKNCWEETVWFDIGETWRKFVQGIGMDKECFPKNGEHVEEGKGVKDRAEEFHLVLHPYTERPEHEFLLEGFQDSLEETLYLFCEIGVQGVFTESIQTALLAARMGCPASGVGTTSSTTEGTTTTTSPSADKSSATASFPNSNKKSLTCWEDTSEANLYFGAATFIMGVFLTAILFMWVNRGFSFKARPPREQQVPGEEPSHDGSLEEHSDNELL
jgi:glycerophosphoryl diester phosphodiesterase